MKIHEYQAKTILCNHDLNVPEGHVAVTVNQAVKAAQDLGNFPVIIKAQVHAGGRGKAGGIKRAQNINEVQSHTESILGMTIKGIPVKRVLVEPAVDIDREFYTGITVDRVIKCPVIIVSTAGGVDIEEVAAAEPGRILHIHLHPGLGLQDYQIRYATYFLDIPKEARKSFKKVLMTLEKVVSEMDASLVEINPLVLTGGKDIVACDAKITFDDNALPRHLDIEPLRDPSEEEPLEQEARQHRLSYVKLEGTIGCVVNGAGLAMASMDLVKHYGGEPANFLDIGGGATPETIAEALRIVSSDPDVRTIFFNIFGGIVRCDRVAEGILKARKTTGVDLPIVMRLVGTNEDKARELLEGTDLLILPTMARAAQKAVEIGRNAT